jgi:hypothetical protein
MFQFFFKLLPVFKSIREIQKSTATSPSQLGQTIHRITFVYGNLSYQYDFLLRDKITVFHKVWDFLEEEIAQKFQKNQQAIFDLLLPHSSLCSAPKFVFLNEKKGQRSFRCKGRTVKASFLPLGETPLISDCPTLIHALIQITGCIAILGELNIVHNDIRWPNIVKLRNNNRIITCVISMMLFYSPRRVRSVLQ